MAVGCLSQLNSAVADRCAVLLELLLLGTPVRPPPQMSAVLLWIKSLCTKTTQ